MEGRRGRTESGRGRCTDCGEIDGGEDRERMRE